MLGNVYYDHLFFTNFMGECHIMKFFRSAMLLVGAIFLSACIATAQTASGSLSGHVTDPSGAAVVGANVTALNTQTGVSNQTTSNKAGDYAFPTLLPGTYKLTISAPGFRDNVTERIILHVQDRLAQNVALKVGSASQTVTVTAASQQINTQDATVGTVVSRQIVANMPLNGRSFQGLITLSPGVATVIPTSNSPGQFVVNGQRSDTNYFTVDGVSANVAAPVGGGVGSGSGSAPTGSATGGFNTMVSLDALEEFRISTSSFAPEFGRTPGGQIALVTRSGTNRFHGDAFEYFRNTVLDANDWFLNANGKPRGVVQQNDFGGTLGGPIFKNKLFFFASYEGLRLSAPSPSVKPVPTQAARTLAANTNANGVVGYMAQFLNAYPLPTGNPTTPCTSVNTCVANFTGSFPSTSKLDATSVRGDYTINSKMTLFGRYSHSPSNLTSANTVNSTKLIEGNDTYTAGWTYAINDALSNDARFNYTYTTYRASLVPLNYSGSLSTIFPSGYAQIPAGYSEPNIKIGVVQFAGGVDGFTWSPANVNNSNTQDNVTDTLTWIKGAHQFKFGVDYVALFPNQDQVTFNSNYSFAGTNVCPGGLPAYICGLANVANIQHNTPQHYRFNLYSFFAQDTWKTTDKLTLTYGLRWEINPPVEWTNNYPSFSIYQPSFNLDNLTQTTLNPLGTPIYDTRFGNVSPRIGLAYQISADPNWGRTLRAGYGIFYDTGNQASSISNSPWNARCNNLTACTIPPYTGPALPLVPFPISLANNRFTSPPTIVRPVVFPIALQTDVLTDPNFKQPFVHQTNLTLEQQLGPAQTLTLAYVGAFGERLIGELVFPPNLTNANELGQGSNCAAKPNCGDTWYVQGNYSSSNYNSFQAKLQRQFIHNIGGLVSYTWSHSIDNTSSAATVGNPTVPTAATLSTSRPTTLYRGNSDFDIRHIFAASLVSVIPGPSHGIGKVLLGDWSVDPIYHFQSAAPIDVIANKNATFAAAPNLSQRPTLIPGIPIFVSGAACVAQYGAKLGINACPGGKALNIAPVPAATAAAVGCAAPTATNAKGAFCTPKPVGTQAVSGNFGRNVLRSYPLQQLDLSVHKDFALVKQLHFRFQMDMFNVFNQPNFGPIDSTMLDTNFGLTTAMANSALGAANSGGAGFNPVFATGGPRNFQFAGKFTF